MKASEASDGKKFWTLAAMSLGFDVVQLDVTIVNTALHSIGSSVGGGVAALQWAVNAYTIAFASLILTAGALGDRVGAKKIFMMGFALFTGASLACAVAPSVGILIAARALQGLGAAILVPNSLALLNHSYRQETNRKKAVGIWAAGASIARQHGGGHLIEAQVRPTLEVILTESPKHLTRRFDKESGLALISLKDGTSD